MHDYFQVNTNPAEPHGLDTENTDFTTIRFNIGRSGMFDNPATP
jgi:hypothetical protein